MLKVENLSACVAEAQKTILREVGLEIKKGEIHVLMGMNGSGKSTLCNVLAGKAAYAITDGSMRLDEVDFTKTSPEQRSQMGIFMTFQSPVEIPGLSNLYFLRTMLNIHLKLKGKPELDAFSFIQVINNLLPHVGLQKDFLYRSVNTGFSGGERKKNEILQLLLLEPKLAILDEIDSGLDIDAIENITNIIHQCKSKGQSFLIVTHYQRILEKIDIDYVHLLHEGHILKTGDRSLAKYIEKNGYKSLIYV